MREIEMDQETALVLLRSGQMPISRYVELAREHGWPAVVIGSTSPVCPIPRIIITWPD